MPGDPPTRADLLGDWVARRLVDRLERDERLAESDSGVGLGWALINFRVHRARARVYYTHVIDLGWLLIAVMTGSVFLCALPLLIVTVACLRLEWENMSEELAEKITPPLLRVVSRLVTGFYILSFLCLLLTAYAWREMVGIATYAFVIMCLVGALMSAIEWRCRRSEGERGFGKR